jgi:hypothetical protein
VTVVYKMQAATLKFTPFTGLGAQRSLYTPSMQPAARAGGFRLATAANACTRLLASGVGHTSWLAVACRLDAAVLCRSPGAHPAGVGGQPSQADSQQGAALELRLGPRRQCSAASLLIMRMGAASRESDLCERLGAALICECRWRARPSGRGWQCSAQTNTSMRRYAADWFEDLTYGAGFRTVSTGSYHSLPTLSLPPTCCKV